jgi:hypothetical protein
MSEFSKSGTKEVGAFFPLTVGYMRMLQFFPEGQYKTAPPELEDKLNRDFIVNTPPQSTFASVTDGI